MHIKNISRVVVKPPEICLFWFLLFVFFYSSEFSIEREIYYFAVVTSIFSLIFFLFITPFYISLISVSPLIICFIWIIGQFFSYFLYSKEYFYFAGFVFYTFFYSLYLTRLQVGQIERSLYKATACFSAFMVSNSLFDIFDYSVNSASSNLALVYFCIRTVDKKISVRNSLNFFLLFLILREFLNGPYLAYEIISYIIACYFAWRKILLHRLPLWTFALISGATCIAFFHFYYQSLLSVWLGFLDKEAVRLKQLSALGTFNFYPKFFLGDKSRDPSGYVELAFVNIIEFYGYFLGMMFYLFFAAVLYRGLKEEKLKSLSLSILIIMLPFNMNNVMAAPILVIFHSILCFGLIHPGLRRPLVCNLRVPH